MGLGYYGWVGDEKVCEGIKVVFWKSNYTSAKSFNVVKTFCTLRLRLRLRLTGISVLSIGCGHVDLPRCKVATKYESEGDKVVLDASIENLFESLECFRMIEPEIGKDEQGCFGESLCKDTLVFLL